MAILDDSQLVSVIIPVYNVRLYIEEALDSVIDQTYHNLEIIIIDDGSTDGSGEICDQYKTKDNRITVIHQDNKGLSEARNAGLDVASGEIIAFLDSDDAYIPDMISMMMEGIQKHQADIAICNFSVQETKGQMKQEKVKKPIWHLCNKRESYSKLLYGGINTAPWNRLYRKKIWKNLRFPAGRVYEGTFISFDIFDRAEKVVITSEALVMHRIRPGSICNTISLKNTMDFFFHLNTIFHLSEIIRLRYFLKRNYGN